MNPGDGESQGIGRREIQHATQRFRQVGEQRLARILDSLTREQASFFTLLPLLLHVNHPALPGYAGSEVPAGIAGYLPDRNAVLLARRYARSLKKEQRPQRQPPLLGFYLIGSSGTVGQDRQSDFDFWVCHQPDLQASQIERLRDKAALLETHAKSLGLTIHFFLMHAESFRDGQHARLSDESSGNTQHHLLLEEFYRSGLLLAGRPPLWWVVPTQQAARYTEYARNLIEKRFIREDDWLDFGGLEDISAEEFFSAAHWQLFKSIELPYKALLKLKLFEAYALEYPKVRWLCEDLKALVHSDQPIDADAVDAYQLMIARIEQHLAGQSQRLELARRAFCFKSGLRLSQAPQDHWKSRVLAECAERWGWQRGELLNLDAHREWKLEQVMDERNQLVAELSRSYRLLTELARHNEGASEQVRSDLALLGRKLYSALERRPGKIDRVNPGISDDISEDVVWLRHDDAEDTWQLYLQDPQLTAPPALKSTLSLVELLAWLHVNGVLARHTRIDLPGRERGPVSNEHLHIVGKLRKLLPEEQGPGTPLGNYAKPAHGGSAFAFINPLHSPIDADPRQVISDRSDPLSFGPTRRNLVIHIDHLFSNSWGELQVDHYRGDEGLLELLCAHLELYRHTAAPAPLQCHCDTPLLGKTIADRIARLAAQALNFFREHGEQARLVLCIGEEFHLIEQRRGQYDHLPVGDHEALLELLGESQEHFRPTQLDDAALPRSPLPLLMSLNRPQQVQVFFHSRRDGVELYVLDDSGALFRQDFPGAEETYLLNQQQRFFETLRMWRQPLGEADAPCELHFARLQLRNNRWQNQALPIRPAVFSDHTELLLSSGRRGPWRDGFSLISGDREFNSLAMGDMLYQQTARYLLGLRRAGARYPIYLTGVVIADEIQSVPVPLVELLRFKALVEKRLAEALARLTSAN